MNHYETYVPSDALVIHEPATFIADTLIQALRESNALEFMPPEQRFALIYELCKDKVCCLDKEENKAVEWYNDLKQIQALMNKEFLPS